VLRLLELFSINNYLIYIWLRLSITIYSNSLGMFSIIFNPRMRLAYDWPIQLLIKSDMKCGQSSNNFMTAIIAAAYVNCFYARDGLSSDVNKY